MDFRKKYLKEYIRNTLKSVFSTQTIGKAITKPWKIPGALFHVYKNTDNILNDVKLKPLSAEYSLNVVSASVAALAKLSDSQSNLLPVVKNVTAAYGEHGIHPADAEGLGAYFKFHGSDKSTDHNYYIVYASLLSGKKSQPINILEIGLGTNNLDIMSNMGTYGHPGASLRAFRDMYKDAHVFGADIDKRILFAEERILTYFVDQTNPATFEDLKTQLGNITFDLIIDDGLHNAQANLNTTNFALGLLKPDGVFVVEDVNRADFQYYQIVAAILKDKYNLEFLETKSGACICTFKKVIPS